MLATKRGRKAESGFIPPPPPRYHTRPLPSLSNHTQKNFTKIVILCTADSGTASSPPENETETSVKKACFLTNARRKRSLCAATPGALNRVPSSQLNPPPDPAGCTGPRIARSSPLPLPRDISSSSLSSSKLRGTRPTAFPSVCCSHFFSLTKHTHTHTHHPPPNNPNKNDPSSFAYGYVHKGYPPS